ncbi:FkbM family methyltransferase [Altericista sp. CCNU0014]|uniref:FkbM family methyltransferase n=1 Tax=Altericista sp. CCNU0014 TaxID=3082949 RepID=UPI00384F6956
MGNSVLSKKSLNELKIHFPQKGGFQFFDETEFLYEEVQQYFKNGICVREGDTVFDVGANIGLFSIYLYQMCDRDVDIYAFEPIPNIFDALSLNISQLETQKIKIFPFGLSNASKIVNFAYHPNAPALSTMYPFDSKEYRTDIRNNVIENLEHAPRHIRRLLSLVPPWLRPFFIDRDLNQIFQVESVSCQLKKMSDIIREYDIQKINLLKVDVEKSEADVLLGIDDRDWPKIDRVVVEVHDENDRLKKIQALLTDRGFRRIFVRQDPFLKAAETFNLYAIR